jgi:hypothetical protein
LREAPELLLREDQLVAGSDLEDAAAAADEQGFQAELVLDLSRQTGGSRIVVSARAVFDGNRQAIVVGWHRVLLKALFYKARKSMLHARNEMPSRPCCGV